MASNKFCVQVLGHAFRTGTDFRDNPRIKCG